MTADMMRQLRKTICVLTWLLAFVAGGASAQDDFNPTNPPEPSQTYRVTVAATPSDKATASGNGRYSEGQSVLINSSSSDVDYVFSHWTKDGEFYSSTNRFYYTVQPKDVAFEAVYVLRDFNPTNPQEPEVINQYALTLVSDPEGACSFNIDSGTRYTAGTSIYICAYANQGFVFGGWWDGDTKVSSATSFTYVMPEAAKTLTARYVYNPDSPAEPETEDIPTRINETGADNRQTTVFTLQGQAVPSVRCGVYIVGRKKVCVK